MESMKMAGMQRKDLINAQTGSIKLQSMKEKVITVTGLAVGQAIDNETGELKPVGYLATSDGVYGTVSATVIPAIENIIDAVDDGDISFPCEIKVHGRTSNGGREFLTLSVM